jgi:hypothetical protein
MVPPLVVPMQLALLVAAAGLDDDHYQIWEKAQGPLNVSNQTSTFAFLAEEPKSERGCRRKDRRADGSGIGGSLALNHANMDARDVER